MEVICDLSESSFRSLFEKEAVMNLKSRNEYEARNVRLMDIGYPFRFNDNPAKTTKSFVKSLPTLLESSSVVLSKVIKILITFVPKILLGIVSKIRTKL